MNLLDPISKIMSDKLITVSKNDPIFLLGELFNKHRIHHVLVTQSSDLLGMVSKSDFLLFQRGIGNKSSEKKLDELRMKSHLVEEIMTSKLATMQKDEKINVALEIFKENLFHAIPILDQDELVGIVTPLDIINRLAEDKLAENKYNLQ